MTIPVGDEYDEEYTDEYEEEYEEEYDDEVEPPDAPPLPPHPIPPLQREIQVRQPLGKFRILP